MKKIAFKILILIYKKIYKVNNYASINMLIEIIKNKNFKVNLKGFTEETWNICNLTNDISK